MIQGTYYKEWSRMLGRDMEFKVYGHAGTPVLACLLYTSDAADD